MSQLFVGVSRWRRTRKGKGMCHLFQELTCHRIKITAFKQNKAQVLYWWQ